MTKSKISSKKKAASAPKRGIKASGIEPSDWRLDMLAKIRKVIRQADPDVVEEVKWRKPSNAMRGVPVWSHDGILCTGETYKIAVKMTFANGASLEDPTGLFNAGLEGNTRRAIDFHEGDEIDEKALQALIRAAVALNTAKRTTARTVRTLKRPKTAQVALEKLHKDR
ncbi:MAG: hypothetical protein C0483_17305 [Pirellula sp.]|nr:hypothetical protein [Pirellula sp.]